MDYYQLHRKLTKIFDEIHLNKKVTIPSESLFNLLNCMEFYITLHDVRLMRPIYINDHLKRYYGFDKNTFDIVDYIYYLQTVHPSKYGALLDSFHFFRRADTGFLDLTYKLKNYQGKYSTFQCSTKSIFIEGQPNFAITVMQMIPRDDKSLTHSTLTSREREIIEHYLHGKTVKHVAISLFISENTVKAHLKNIYRKIGVRNARELHNFFE